MPEKSSDSKSEDTLENVDAELKEIEELKELHENLPTPISEIKTISYTPYTGAGYGYEDTVVKDKNGNDKIVTAVENNLNAFEAAVDAAAKDLEKSDMDGVTPVFVAPEWVFKKKGEENGVYYDNVECQKICERLAEISKKHKNMVIFAGSVKWATDQKDLKSQKKKFSFRKLKSEDKFEYDEYKNVNNTAVVLSNGGIVHIAHKNTEGIDIDNKLAKEGKVVFGMQPEQGLKNAGLNDNQIKNYNEKFPGRLDALKKYADKLKSTPENSEEGKSPVIKNYFDHKGVRFGVEVCGDHKELILKDQLKAHDQPPVDVHVLVSCGAKPMPSKIATVDKGILIHCDGSAHKDATEREAKELRQMAAGASIVEINNKTGNFVLPKTTLNGKTFSADGDMVIANEPVTVEKHSGFADWSKQRRLERQRLKQLKRQKLLMKTRQILGKAKSDMKKLKELNKNREKTVKKDKGKERDSVRPN